MPESRAHAEKRAEREGFPKSSVICLDGDSMCFIVPHGIETAAGRRAYAEARAKGRSKEYSARVAHKVEELAKDD